jgi:NitT/TauT family transport system substrate-binding protein
MISVIFTFLMYVHDSTNYNVFSGCLLDVKQLYTGKILEKMKRLSSIFFITLLLLLSACSPASNSISSLMPITIQLASAHRASSAGFYAADQNGDYVHEGLAVKFIEGTPDLDLAASVLDGTAQFGVMSASTLISARAEGHPIRALATILRRDPAVFFSLAESGITHVEDFVGKKIFLSPRGRPRLYSMLARVGIKPDEITEVNTGNFTALYTGEVDSALGSITSDLLSIKQAGYTVNLIYPDDYGVHFYASVIFTSDDYIAANSEVVTRFVRATLQGWAYAIENPQTIGDMVLKYNPDADSAFETASMVASLPYINTGEDYIGWMKPDVWQKMALTMHDQGDLTTPVDISEVYTLQFIEQIYGGNNP